MDFVDSITRSRMMAAVRGRNTSPELVLRRALYALGFRYRLHARDLPGCPDIVLPKWNTVVQVHGCFWHGHRCNRFSWPKQNASFWRSKILRNRFVDRRAERALAALGWHVLVVWECAVRGMDPKRVSRVATSVAREIRSSGDRHLAGEGS